MRGENPAFQQRKQLRSALTKFRRRTTERRFVTALIRSGPQKVRTSLQDASVHPPMHDTPKCELPKCYGEFREMGVQSVRFDVATNT